jgi:hypothetical protein
MGSLVAAGGLDMTSVADKKSSLAGELPVSFLHHPFHFPLRLLRLDRLPLVIGLLALGKTDQHLGLAAHEIDLERDEREPFLRYLPGDLSDLFFMQQELARPERLVVCNVAMCIRADVRVEKVHLFIPDDGVAVRQVCEPQAQGLDLGALQRDAGLNGLLDEVVVVRLAVRSDRGVLFLFCHT